MIQIRLEQSSRVFRPRSRIAGTIEWTAEDRDLTGVDVRLIWYTRGKGTQDVATVQSRSIAVRGPSGSAPFEFEAPNGPYSFSGRLVSLVWAVEAVARPMGDAERREIVIGPEGREIFLPVESVAGKK